MGTTSLLKGDITLQSVDAIVNAANSSLMGGGGVDGAIHRAGGKNISEQCRDYILKYSRLPPGEAMITTGGNLAAKFVIHTVGPVWHGGNSDEEMLLASAYKNSLQLAGDNHLITIAFPNISTGIYHFPRKKAAIIAIETVNKFLAKATTIERVYFVCYDDENYKIYEQLLYSS